MDNGNEQSKLALKRRGTVKGILAALAAVSLVAIPLQANANGGRHDDERGHGHGHGHHQPKLLSCDDTLKDDFKPDRLTTVLLVKAFKKGDALLLTGTPTPNTPIAANDVCVVKLLVGPGNPGPVGAPSTSPGIGIEIWLPSRENWNRRIHVAGGGGWAGGNQTSLTLLSGAGGAGGTTPSPSFIATVEGAVSANTDTGHSGPGGGSFAMNPDGTPNSVLWDDFARRGIHEMAVKSKAITKAYYGKEQRYAYWDGFSTGGRQAHKLAQVHPDDFDGILAGAPAFNWVKFITAELYPQIVMQRDLGGVLLTSAQQALMGNAAINKCDVVNGQHLGYIPDPSTCRYDPTKDASVLCAANGGTNTTADCVTPLQARAMNKIWYGQTRDGSAPPPVLDNGWPRTLDRNHIWYGLTRGTNTSSLAGTNPFTIATDLVALELQDPTLGTPSFVNATGNGANGWKNLSYADLGHARDEGIRLQPKFGFINTDNADLRHFRNSGGKMLMYHGLSDVLIMPQGSVNYYERVLHEMGGLDKVQKFYRFFLVPGMAHGFSNGTSNPTANPPLPASAGANGMSQLYELLTKWVEEGEAPSRIDISTVATTTFPVVKSRPICAYPKKAKYRSGDVNVASSYRCAD